MKAVVINLTPITETSTLINPSIATFIADTLKIPAIWKEEDIRAAKPEIVIVVNGLGQFCKARGAIGDAIANCRQFVWVMNDYRVQFPRPHSEGSSEILDGVRRGMKRGMEFSYWATVPKVLTTSTSRYVNWNAVAYRPDRRDLMKRSPERRIIYYGALRPMRLETFDHYFGDALFNNLITVAAPERAHENWRARYPDLNLVPALPRPIEPVLQDYAMGLYLQDASKYYESPASRFYELLGAGVPIIFQPEAQLKLMTDDPMLPNLDIHDEWVVTGPEDYERLLRKRSQILEAQQARWGGTDHRAILASRVKQVFSELIRRAGGCSQTGEVRSKLISGG
jgi:hypothetical protein